MRNLIILTLILIFASCTRPDREPVISKSLVDVRAVTSKDVVFKVRVDTTIFKSGDKVMYSTSRGIVITNYYQGSSDHIILTLDY